MRDAPTGLGCAQNRLICVRRTPQIPARQGANTPRSARSVRLATSQSVTPGARGAKPSSSARTGPFPDGTTLVYGQTHAGRHLLVVAVDEGGQAFVVTARDMTDAEKKTFRRKAR